MLAPRALQPFLLPNFMPSTDFRIASDRNKHPILEVLLRILPAQGNALEIACGTGQHAQWFAQHLPGWQWLPSDVDVDALRTTDARLANSGLPNVRPATALDVMDTSWFAGAPPAPHFDLVFCCNMLHVAPWECCAALMRGAARHLAPGGRLITYGPYFEDGVPTAQSNLDFDSNLRAVDPRRGVRHLTEVMREAKTAGLDLHTRFAMPSNNLLLVWNHNRTP
jgi:SAM-dependent methyltransferase